jgi:type II secretory pathway component PulK
VRAIRAKAAALLQAQPQHLIARAIELARAVLQAEVQAADTRIQAAISRHGIRKSFSA